MSNRPGNSTRLHNLPPGRATRLWIIFTQILVLAPHALHLPLWSFITSLGLMLLAATLVWRERPLPPRFLLGLMAICGGIGCFVYFGTLNGRDPGVTLLSLMLSLKLLEMRSLRDAMLVVFLGYFLIITQFLYSQHMLLVLYLIMATLAVTIGMISLADVNERLGFRRQLLFSSRLLLQALPFMLLLFVLFPRIHGPLWGIPSEEGQARSGLSDSMEPGQFSSLIRSDQPAFRAVFDTTLPSKADRYWRGPVLWHFDGRRWTGRNEPDATSAFPIPTTLAPPIAYKLILEPSDRPWVLALDIPARVPAGLRINEDFQLLADHPIGEVSEYKLSAYTRYRIDAQLDEHERQLGLQLPQDVAPKARQLALTWRKQSKSPEEIVQRALDYFRKQAFFYTLTPPLMRQDPVDQFLFESRRGFCEHYAGSFVFLMRAAGIPARVVTGYLGGEYNPLGRYLLIRQSDAHAWTEIWLKGRGWVRIDPTAAIAPERIELGIASALPASDELPLLLRNRYGNSLLNHMRMIWDSADYYWNYWVLAFGPERQQEFIRHLGLGDLDWQELIITLIVTTSGVILIYGLVFWLRERRQHPDPVQRHYLRFLKKLERTGIRTHASEGPQALLSRIELERPDLALQVHHILQRYIQLRYAHVNDRDRELSEFSRNISSFRPQRRGVRPGKFHPPS
jgi:transglutaminase-like putative cysteine protease